MSGTSDVEEVRLAPEDWPGALATTDGPQLVVAGPGAGKTEFLVRRAVHLVTAGVEPARIAVLTFSRRGASELTRRLRQAVGPGRTAPRAATFHSLAARIVETHGPAVGGWSEPPALLTGPEQVALVAELLVAEDRAVWPPGLADLLGSRSFAEEVTDFVLRAREHLLGGADLAAAAAGRDDWRAMPGFLGRYDAALSERHRLDYATLVVTATRLATDPAVAEALGRDIEYVLVDEYQDTTPAQAAFLAALLPVGGHLTVAADPYQSIYSFRGAELGNVDEFGARFRPPDGRPVRRWVLGTSFRVPAGILAAAERLTAGDLPGAAGPVESAGPGGRVDVAVFDQQTHEADWIAREIQRLHLAEGIPLQAMAVLVRSTRRLLPDLSRALDRRGIAHDRPDARLVDHPAVRAIADLVDLATADRRALPESDQRRAARRLLLGPLLALPLGGEREALRIRVRDGTPWADVLRRIEPPATEAAELIETRDWADRMAAADGFWHVWTGLGALGRTALDDPGWRAALASFAQVLGHLADREPTTTLAEMLARATADDFEAQPLLRFEADEQDRLAVTTLHQAKGLAFDVVIIADAVDGVLPDLRRTSSILHTHLLPAGRRDPAAAARFRVQEEMRLAYTAMTRARERVIWTATAAGLDETEDRPSRFLDAVAGDVDRRPADPSDSPPVTPTEAEARLRRALTDPATPAARRLAALSVLTDATLPHLRPALALAGVRVRGPNDGVVPDEAAFSPSQAMAYEACPRRYALERHLGIGDEPSVWMRFGSVVHAAAEAADRAAIAAGRDHADPDEALAALDDLFDPADFDGPPWSDHWLRRARRAVERLYAAAPPGPWAAAFVERPLRLAIDGEAWRGRADRIDRGPGGLRIVDYKTTATAVSKAEAAASLQLGFYALAAGEDPELAGAGGVSAAELWYPLARGNHVATRCFDLDELDAVRDRLRGIAEAIRAERFPPSPGGGCERCAVRVLCDAWPEGREAFVP